MTELIVPTSGMERIRFISQWAYGNETFRSDHGQLLTMQVSPDMFLIHIADQKQVHFLGLLEPEKSGIHRLYLSHNAKKYPQYEYDKEVYQDFVDILPYWPLMREHFHVTHTHIDIVSFNWQYRPNTVKSTYEY